MNQKERLKSTVLTAVLALLGGAFILLFVWKGPLDMSCKLYQITGYSCSGCGTTRMVQAISQGRFYQAFRYNSFLFLSILVIVILYLIGAFRYIKYNASNEWVITALILYAVLLAGFGVIRNIPLFEWLLPTIIY